MMKRSQIETYTIADEDNDGVEYMVSFSVESFIDDIEVRVCDCRELLGDIKSVNDLCNVEECLTLLKEICSDLY